VQQCGKVRGDRTWVEGDEWRRRGIVRDVSCGAVRELPVRYDKIDDLPAAADTGNSASTAMKQRGGHRKGRQAELFVDTHLAKSKKVLAQLFGKVAAAR
jgi:hypothetical protein